MLVKEFDAVVIQLALGDDSATMEATASDLETETATLAASEPLPEGAVAPTVEMIFDVDFEEGGTLITVLHLVLDAVLFLVETVLPATVLDFEVTVLEIVEVLLEEATLTPVERALEEAVLATELLFADKAAAVVKELFFKETVLVVELLLEITVDVTTEEVFKADVANDELTLVAASEDVTQLALSFSVTSVSTVESFFKHEATVGTATAFLTEGSDIATAELPVLVDATPGLVLDADGLTVTTEEAPDEETTAPDASTVCPGVVTEVCGVSADDAVGDSQGADGDINARVLFSQAPTVASSSTGSTLTTGSTFIRPSRLSDKTDVC